VDIRFIVLPNGELRCRASGLVEQLGWPDAVQTIRMWASMRGMVVSRLRGNFGSLLFYARFQTPSLGRPLRTACLCGWTKTASDIDEMMSLRKNHRATFPSHFSERCAHSGATKTKSFGEVFCVECNGTVGWDVLAQAGIYER